MTDAGHFDRIAATYDEARPGYPTALWAALEQSGALYPGARVLELGAGSGQATRGLVARGAAVEAVEPGPALAARLREALPEITVRLERAEDMVLPEAGYDTVLAATSWHWIDAAAVLPTLHAALRPGGLLAVAWTVFGDEDVRTPFRDRVEQIARDVCLDRRGPIAALQADERKAELATGGYFAAREPVVLRWQVELTPVRLRALFSSFPTWAGTPGAVDRIAEAAAEHGPAVTEHYLSVLYVADRS